MTKTLKCDISGAKTKACENICKSYFIGGQKFYIQTHVNKITNLTNQEYIIKKQQKHAVL